jgi:hypothetical protein
MDVYDGGQWIVGRDRAIGQKADRLCAKRTLDMDLVGGDIGQVRFRNGPYQLERTGAAPRQRFGGQRQRRPHASASRNSGSTSSIVLMDGSRVRLWPSKTVRQ